MVVLGARAGAKRPMRVPTRLARLPAGDQAVVMTTKGRGCSHTEAMRELGWEPRYPSRWQGFEEELA